jgi:hypothetical protein
MTGANPAGDVPLEGPVEIPLAVAKAGAARRHAGAGRGRAALVAAQGIDLPRLHGAILAALAPRLADDLLEAALIQARCLEDPWARGTALAALLPRLPAPLRPDAVTDVLEAARTLEWIAGDVILRDAALALAAGGDAPSARRLLAGVRDEGLRRAALLQRK